MKQHINVALLAALISAASWAQEVSVYSTTMAQAWKESVPGFDKSTYAPATEFLGIDATQLGSDALSLHLYGWGRTDLGDASRPDGKSGGDLAYGYLSYRFQQANAEIKAGRFAINSGVGMEQVDGISARTDLRGGFTLSMFGGKPVLYKTVDSPSQSDYEYQSDIIVGTRLGYRLMRIGELGVSFLQDGSTPGRGLTNPDPVDYTRKQLAGDIRLAPLPALTLIGRTVWDIAKHNETLTGPEPSRIAEHEYTLSYKFTPSFALSGNFAERNFQAYFAGTNLPSLFRQDEKGKFRASGGSLIYVPADSWQVVADYRHTNRDSFGDANRFGGEVRWIPDELKVKAGLGFHRVTATDVVQVDAQVPSYSLSHREVRAWVMYERNILSASLDGILHSYDDKDNPFLNGKTSVYEVVASLGVQANSNLKISGDLDYGANPLFQREVRGLLRAELRFGMGSKGGAK